MQSYKKILVGVDFNSHTGKLPVPTEVAIQKAIWLAKMVSGELSFITVLDPSLEAGADDADSPQSIVNNRLGELINDSAQSDMQISSKIVYGKGWYEITREAIQSDSDLVIVGTREKTTAQRMLYGSTAMKLIRSCPCAVFITRPDVQPLDVETIVAADDFSPVGEKVLHAAVSTGQLIDARLVVVHSVNYPLEGPMRRTEASQEDLDAYKAKCRQDAEDEVNERLSMTDFRTLQQGTQVVIQGGPADSVVEEAVNEHQAGLLVMGTIARGGIPGYLIGNTAERLLPALNCSLLTLKPDDFVPPIKID
ncbi:universal stress protein [bacterium]|jgi:universal stress protein E|nr:universal stress protein [Planctomicrobium sp.]MDB4802717.1 universal stress protein [bacterium]